MKLLTTAAILMTMVMAMTTLEAQAPRWELVTEHAAFSPRDTAEDAVFLGKMWISNAYHAGGELVRDLWNSTDGVTWTKVLDNTPYDGYAEMAVFQGRLWAVKESVWNSADGVNWTKLLDKTPFGPRGYGELVVFKDELWQLGSGDDVWHSQDGVKWECAASGLPWGKRYGAAVAVYGGKLWLCGGAEDKPSDPPEKHYPQYTTHNDVWCSEDGVNWTIVTERAPWLPRQWFIAREWAGRLWIIGGFSNRESRNFAEAWYTRDGVHWTELKSEPMWSPRHEPTVYVYQNALWVVAGNMWPLMNDVWRLRLP
ncbi:MAG: hypothetical protein HPY69_03600 [Armatimonadetes bacterium]|nr:hypothetical protein [Armatimonadota bacterium]